MGQRRFLFRLNATATVLLIAAPPPKFHCYLLYFRPTTADIYGTVGLEYYQGNPVTHRLMTSQHFSWAAAARYD